MAPKRKEVMASPSKAKKPKKDCNAEKLNQQVEEVVKALHQAEVSGAVSKMLSAIAPLSLGEFSEQRHPFQKRVVEGLGRLLNEVEAALNKEVTDKRSTRDEAASVKPLREKEAADAEEKLNAKMAEVQSAKVALAGKAMAFRAARTALAEAEEAKIIDGKNAQDAEKKKAEFNTALENLTALKETASADAEGKKRTNELMASLKKHKFEESMMIALPAALAKTPEARGQFDSVVIGQVEGELQKKIAEQDQILADAAPGQEKCIAAINEAKQSLDAARGEQRVAAQFFDNLSKEQNECSEASATAQKAVRDSASLLKKLEKTLHNAEVEVQIFEQGPRETFKQLCERSAPAPVAEEEEEEAPAAMEESAAEIQLPVAAC